MDNHQALMELLTHWDDALSAQGLEMVMSLSGSERLSLAAQIIATPWRPGQPWMALRVCLDRSEQADLQLKRWCLDCAADAVTILDEDTPSSQAVMVARRYLSRHASTEEMRAALQMAQRAYQRTLQRARSRFESKSATAAIQQTSQRLILLKSIALSMNDIAQNRPSGGWSAPRMLETVFTEADPRYPRQRLLMRCYRLLRISSDPAGTNQ